MKKKHFLLLSILIFSQMGFSQEKANEIIYAEYFQGAEFGDFELSLGTELNYQINKNLFTTRYIYATYEGTKGYHQGFTQPSINEKTSGYLNEISLLYGRRYIKNGHSFSFSLGASYNFYKEKFRKEVGLNPIEIENKSGIYFGIPFEINFKWFKNEKRPYRILGFIPVGEKTTIGNSIGVKLFGNISKKTLIGVGFVLGIGSHKVYDQK